MRFMRTDGKQARHAVRRPAVSSQCSKHYHNITM